jgi:hypothetical protein
MEENVIDLFMWGFQQHFRISIEVTVKDLFKRIDKRLSPKVFLLGILVDEQKDRHPICLEPEDCGFDVKKFSDISSLAKELEKVDEESKIIHSHPTAQKNHEKKISNRAYVDAISKILKREDLYGNHERYISYPTYIEGYLIFIILELQKEVIQQYYSLTKSKIDNRYTIYRSLIESAVNTFLNACIDSSKDPNNPFDAINRPADELMRKAGRQFMYTVSQAGKNSDGLYGLYDSCNEIASMKYEGAVGLGNMIIAPKDHQNIKITLQLKEPIRVNDYRKVRKFLELSDRSSSIVSDSGLIYGLGELRGKYNPKEESLFVVSFTSHFTWELSHDNNPLMVVEYREPRLPIEKIDREKFYSDLKRIFRGISKDQIDDLWEVAIEATKQKHGTMLVISDNAINESERLGKQCFPLKALKLKNKNIQQITSIDGAVLLDRNANCHAIGVILDGLATDKGDASRGARYNSAMRYYEHFGKDKPTVLVIISEDGIINLIPNLMPQIKHSVICKAIEDFEKILEEEKIERSLFNKGMSFFQSVNFYLTQEECDTINSLRKKIEAKDSNTSFRIIYKDLIPNGEMSHSYYLED